jgi:hypothetical protein
MPLRTLALLFVLLTGRLAHAEYAQRWFYVGTNLQVEKNADDLVALITRAAKAGYNGLVLADYKLHILDRVPRHYFTNLEKVKKAAAAAKIEIIPAVCPIGYSSGILAHDPNLAEGLPVRDVPFRVEKGVATLVPFDTGFRNGNLELTKGDRFTGWGFQDDPGVKTVADRAVVAEGKVAVRLEHFRKGGETANARITQRVKVRPFACYRLSARVKTQDLDPAGNLRLLVMGDRTGRLTYQDAEAQQTQDWTAIDVVFNSRDNTEVTLYAGVWDGQKGRAWIDDLKLEELALVNVLRRPGCPLRVTSEDGKISYTEGKDFAPIADAKLGRVPYAGEYAFDHAGPTVRILPGGRIQDGDTIKISWYHPIKIHSYQVMCSLLEPKVFEILRNQVALVDKHLAPKTWFLSHDEIRVAGWCELARKSGKTPGQLLADNAKRCVELVRKQSPKSSILIWSDMFDPHHNAVDRYYAVNGSLKGSWEGLPADVVVVNWNGGKAAQSLKFFAERGHPQILAGFYDSPGTTGFTRWHEAAKGIQNVNGFLYTTWRKDYSRLEVYGKLMQGK